MPKNTVHNVGSLGIVRDIKPQLLPPEVWSDGRNVRFRNGRVEGMGGVVEIVPEIPIDIQNVGLVTGVESTFVLFTDLGKIYAYTGFETTDVSGTSYNERLDNLFEFKVFNGVITANQENNVPQQWDGDTANTFANLTNWDTAWRTRKLRLFGNIWIALRMVENSVRYDHKMRWSHPAEPGAVPSTWDDADATKNAGSFSFGDTENGIIVDGMELAGRFFIYKENAIWALTNVPGPSIFSRQKLLQGVGIDVERSLLYVPKGVQNNAMHFFAGAESFYLFDGVRLHIVFEDIFKKEYLDIRNSTNYRVRSFSVLNRDESEIWFCFPTGTNDFCDRALVLNYNTNKYTIRNLGGSSIIVSGIKISAAGESVKSQIIPYADGTFFEDGTGHLVLTQVPAGSSIIEATPATGKAYGLDTGTLDYDGEAYPRYVTKQSIATVKHDSRDPDATIVDYSRRKLVKEVVPKLYSGRVELEIGTQETENETVEWEYSTLLADSQYKHDLVTPVSGRFISFRFSSVKEEDFELGGFDYSVELLGMF